MFATSTYLSISSTPPLCCLPPQDWTKEELIELIQAEGLEVPGPNEWDQDAGVYRKRVEPKQVYVDFCKRQLFEAEPKPLVRMGKCLKGRDCYCLVDIFKVRA